MVALINFLIKIKEIPLFLKTSDPENPKIVILLFKDTCSPLRDFQEPKSATFGVITGNFVKLFTPDAKNK